MTLPVEQRSVTAVRGTCSAIRGERVHRWLCKSSWRSWWFTS